MRVVLYTQWFPPEKAGQLTDIAEALTDRGHDVSVVTGFPNYPTGKIYDGWRQRPWANYAADGYRVKRVIQFPSHDASALRRAASYFSFGLASAVFGWRQLRQADVVYVYHPPLTTVIGPWLNRLIGGAPYVLHVQDLWPDSVIAAEMLSGRLAGSIYRALSHLCGIAYRGADVILCIAPTMAALLRERGVPEYKLKVLGNWTDESVFRPVERHEDVAQSLGLAGSTSVMFAGNMGAVQGLETAIRAAAAVQDLPDFRLVLVGDGVRRESLQALARDINARNVTFLGPRPVAEMSEITAAADVQLISLRDRPHLRGTIPSKLASVMATGLPIICAVAGDSRELVRQAQAGWTCESDDVEALAGAFRAFYTSSPAERRMRGAAGRAYYVTTMAKSIGVTSIEEILRGVANAAPARSRRTIQQTEDLRVEESTP